MQGQLDRADIAIEVAMEDPGVFLTSTMALKNLDRAVRDLTGVCDHLVGHMGMIHHTVKENGMHPGASGLFRVAKANVEPVRQRTQYSCMAASMTMCLKALGYDSLDEDQVNRVMGAQPMKGAAWEQALACAQHYGCRATLTMPATVEQLKRWTDAGVPVMIAWNPEGRPWSHASVVFDVDDDLNVYVADPNIPNPKETVRIVSEAEFYGKWYEKFPDYLVRRPACAIEREITLDGKQVRLASKKTATFQTWDNPHESPKGVRYPRSKWDIFGRKSPFRWATPAANIDGSFPEPWRVTDKDAALDLLKKTFPQNRDIYVEYESDLWRGFGRLWVGLRDNRDKAAHLARLQQMWTELGEQDLPALFEQGRLWLLDDVKKDVLRGRQASTTRFQIEFETTESVSLLDLDTGRNVSREHPEFWAAAGIQNRGGDFADPNYTFLSWLEGAKHLKSPHNPSHPALASFGPFTKQEALALAKEYGQKKRRAAGPVAKGPQTAPKTQDEKRREQNKVKVEQSTPRNDAARALAERGNKGQGVHKNKQDFDRGQARNPKHKKPFDREASILEHLNDVFLTKRGMAMPEVDLKALARRADALLGGLVHTKMDGSQGLEFPYWANYGGKPSLRISVKAGHRLEDSFIVEPSSPMVAAARKLAEEFGLTYLRFQDIEKGWGEFVFAPAGGQRMAGKANYNEWVSLVPGSEELFSREQKALNAFWNFCQGELVEAVKLDDALKMVAWDMGYQGRTLRFAPGLEFLARIRHVNLTPEFNDGQKAGQENKQAAYSGNPDGKPIYPVQVDHGEEHALSGGHDIMKRLQDELRIEQGGSARSNQETRLAARWNVNTSGEVKSQSIERLARRFQNGGGER